MSKVITKKELDLVIESTLEEAGLVSEESLCEECQGKGCKSCEERDEFDGRAGEVIGVDSDIDKQRMGEEEDSKPDFLDLDDDNDTEEPMKKAAKEKESMEESTEDNNDKLLKEELNKFNKIINYRK